MKQATTTIKGQQYRLIKLNPVKGGRVAVRVGRLLAQAAADGDAIQTLMAAFKSRTEGQDGAKAAEALTDSPLLLQAMAGGLAKVDPDALYDAAMECARGNLLTPTGKLDDDMAFDAWFEERPDALFLVLAWTLKENCSGFFGLGARA